MFGLVRLLVGLGSARCHVLTPRAAKNVSLHLAALVVSLCNPCGHRVHPARAWVLLAEGSRHELQVHVPERMQGHAVSEGMWGHTCSRICRESALSSSSGCQPANGWQPRMGVVCFVKSSLVRQLSSQQHVHIRMMFCTAVDRGYFRRRFLTRARCMLDIRVASISRKL